MCFSSALFATRVFSRCCPPIPLKHHRCSVKPPCGSWAFPLKSKRVIGAYWWQDLCYSAGQPRGRFCIKSCSSCASWHPPALQAVPRGGCFWECHWFSALFVCRGTQVLWGVPLSWKRRKPFFELKELNQSNGEPNFSLSLLVIEKSRCIDSSPQSSVPCL